MSIIEEERVEDPIAETLSATCVGSVSARGWSKIIIGGEEKDLRSLSIMTLALRGFLRSAVKDLTVFKAFCLALRPTFLTASERDDRDVSEVTDGERLCFRLAMFAKKATTFLLTVIYGYNYVLYSFTTPISFMLICGFLGVRVCRVGVGSHQCDPTRSRVLPEPAARH